MYAWHMLYIIYKMVIVELRAILLHVHVSAYTVFSSVKLTCVVISSHLLSI